MMRKLLTFLSVLAMLAMLAAGAACGYLAWELSRPLQSGAAAVEFQVERGKTLLGVAKQLETQKLLRHDWTFRVLNRLAADRAPVQAGVFALSAARSPAELFWHLRYGQPVLRLITIIEGAQIAEIAPLLSAYTKGASKPEEVLALLRDPEFARSLGVPQQNLEGYLLPETYSFPDQTPVRRIVEVMVESHFKALPPDYQQREAALGLNHHQLVTLASLVEAETPLDEEKPLVSEVFYQRHKKGMRLQCDPTTVYGIRDVPPPITKADLERDHPYNTYRRAGLPPGPINNPGRQALLAALAPANAGNLYFVAKADGSRGHAFSKSLNEHNRAVAVYRNRIRAQRQGMK
jgi:UPF0755 protein